MKARGKEHTRAHAWERSVYKCEGPRWERLSGMAVSQSVHPFSNIMPPFLSVPGAEPVEVPGLLFPLLHLRSEGHRAKWQGKQYRQ